MANQLNVVLVGRGPVTLGQSNYLTTGGEGSIYRLNDSVIKIFTDSDKMRNDDMTSKINLLSQIKHPWIIAPTGIVTDNQKKPIGYYMPFAKGDQLPRFFTNDFRSTISFGDHDASKLVERMQEVIKVAHSHHALVVDCNEYGWIVGFQKGHRPVPQIVDVDSWQISRWPAKVIMPSIRDYNAKQFSELTDWFSWAVVTFQVYTGIHPYKGTMPGFARNDFIGRMKKNASVFGKDVRLNRAVRDFSCIPKRLLSWYEDTFQAGQRSIPPSPFDSAVSTTPKTVVQRVTVGNGSGALVFKKLFVAPATDPVKRIFDCGVALLQSNNLVNLENGLRIGTAQTSDCEVVTAESGWLVVERIDGAIHAWHTEGQADRTDLNLNLAATGVLRYQDRVFAITGQGVTELMLRVFTKAVLTTGTTWPVMTTSAKFYDGIGIQNMFGKTFFILPHGLDMLSYVRVVELDGLSIVHAKSSYSFATVMTLDKQGVYHKFQFAFDKGHQSYQLTKTEVDSPEFTIAVLGRGVCATVEEDGELIVFVPSTGRINRFSDKTIATDEPLFAWIDKVLLVRQGDVWHVSVAQQP